LFWVVGSFELAIRFENDQSGEAAASRRVYGPALAQTVVP
jgi:hypothetical protein